MFYRYIYLYVLKKTKTEIYDGRAMKCKHSLSFKFSD